MSLEPPEQDSDEGTPSVAKQRESALDLLADIAKGETDLAPLVMVVEDAHSIDATTIELIERILDRLRRSKRVFQFGPDTESGDPVRRHHRYSSTIRANADDSVALD